MAVDSIWGNIFKKPKPFGIETLEDVPIFSGLSQKDLKKLNRIAHRRTYASQEVVFKEREPGVGMYIIEEGSVDIIQKTRDGGEILLAHLEAGEFFGELAMLDGYPRSASAIATQESEIIGFCWPEMHQLIQNDPGLGIKVLLELARTTGMRLRHTNQLLKDIETSQMPPEHLPSSSKT